MRINLIYISVFCLALITSSIRAADDLEIRGLGEIQVLYNDAELNRLNYTAIGDGVNLASRLESATKELGVPVIVSESTMSQAPGFHYQALDTISVKGKKKPVRIFVQSAP